MLLVFNRFLSAFHEATYWHYLRVGGPFGTVVSARVTKPNLSKDGHLFGNVFQSPSGGLQDTIDITMTEPFSWGWHWEYPLEPQIGFEDIEWLPDGMSAEGFAEVDSAVAEWPDLDTIMVDP